MFKYDAGGIRTVLILGDIITLICIKDMKTSQLHIETWETLILSFIMLFMTFWLRNLDNWES
jgi:hypothetical protein